MKYILLILSCLLYLFEFTKAFSVTFPRFKKNYAIVKNIKVNKLTDNDKKELKYIFNAVPVIVFKDQKINPQEYYDFCKIFDDNYNNLTLHPWENCAPKNVPQIALRSTHIINDKYGINNIHGGLGKDITFKYNYKWHQDLVGSSKFLPPVVSSIYTLITPHKKNDNTLFVDLEQAYDNLDMKLKRKLSKYNVIYHNNIERAQNSYWDNTGYIRKDILLNKYVDDNIIKQPLVIYSDKTKYRKSLLLNPVRFLKFDKLNYDDSNDLYRHIMNNFIFRENNIIEHKWENNDICIFNNRKLIHTSSPSIEYENDKRMYKILFLGTNEPIISVIENENENNRYKR